ncbi:uncharacterized protein LOC128875249 [Hylaeus volcanicus]|uniref:uncharacterized protein LOC128875249 n=1 Tax=Hylaeus volcanicus TaxID=313075 RepID=UPI0023B84D9E|nr:uncharacterized protein LOC128875249 [Hylaeus volcanicus]
MVRRLFERFLKEEKKYERIKEKLDRIEKSLVIVRRRFLNSIDNYFQAKRNLENARDKLSKQRQIRFANDAEINVPEVERVIGRDIACYEKVLTNLEEELTRAENEIRDSSQEQLELRFKLKSGFREYCIKMDLLPVYSENSMEMLLEPVDKESLGVIRRRFNQFQRTMVRKLEERERTKKVRLDDKRACRDIN